MQAQHELHFLRSDLKSGNLDDAQVTQRLARLKVIARDPAKAPSVYCSDGLSTLAQIAFEQDSNTEQHSSSSLEAARIIANALLLRDDTQQIFADLGFVDRLVTFYSHHSADYEFVGGRILFLLTYKSNVDFEDLVENQRLVDHMSLHLQGHVSSISAGTFVSNSMNAMALTETLKLIYNTASRCQTQSEVFSRLIPELISLVNSISIPLKALDPPMSQLLNALGVIEWPASLVASDENSEQLVLLAQRLVELVDKSVSSMPTAELESQLIAPLTVLRKLVQLSHPETIQLLRVKLLPQDEERDKPLGQSHTLASRLLQLQSSAGVLVLPEAISGLLFDLSDRDAATFIRNIGYGHAAGYLMTHQIAVPEDLVIEAGKNNSGRAGAEINPITGQRLDAEPQPVPPDMSDEEKEREAQRLFVLFERLKATGIANVENPMRVAQQSGRFEELSDSDPD